jgi:hypothetical protein
MVLIKEDNVESQPNNLTMGSLILEGELHRKLSLGCQDACQTVDLGSVKVAIVCDGCSTTDRGFTQNQVGAVLGAQFIGESLAKRLEETPDIDDKQFEIALRKTVALTYKFFRQLCLRMGLVSSSVEWKDFIYNKLMFTVLGFAVVGDKYWVFGLGDGCYGIGDEIKIIDSTPTIYLNQWLLVEDAKKKLGMVIHHKGNIGDLTHIWVASDGLSSVLLNSSNQKEFRDFLIDEFAGERDQQGNDTTIQAFRRTFYRSHRARLSDDVALALLKHSQKNEQWQESAHQMENYQ